jgi:nucleoside 2-deoxyribosyltransferase
VKVVICSSTKYHEFAKYYADEIKKAGVDVFCPPKVSGTEKWVQLTADEKRKEVKKLIDEHFSEISSSDAILVINKDGYIGTSVNIEIGYAIAKSKLIFTIEPDADLSRSTLIEAVLENPRQIKQLLVH